MGCDGQHAERDLRRTASTRSSSRGSPRCRRRRAAVRSNNFLAPPIPDTILGDSDYYMWPRTTCSSAARPRVRQLLAPARAGEVRLARCRSRSRPRPIRTRRTRGSTGSTTTQIISNTIVNHMSMGYLNRNEGYGSREPGLRRSVPADRRRRRSQRAAADRPGRLRDMGQQRRRQPRERHDAADLHHQRHA